MYTCSFSLSFARRMSHSIFHYSGVIPQVFSRLNHPEADVRRSVSDHTQARHARSLSLTPVCQKSVNMKVAE